MAILTNITTVQGSSLTEDASACMFVTKEFLKTAGWTVAGSSDGSTGGMDGIDRIVSAEILSNTDRWFVLQSPHSNAADRIQILFSKPSSQPDDGEIAYNPNADYAGVTTAVPTSSYSQVVVTGDFLPLNADVTYHMLADDAAPYGFATLGVTGISAAFSVACVPFDTQPATNPGKPYAIFASNEANIALTYFDSGMGSETSTTSNPHLVAEPTNPPQVPVNCTACTINTISGIVMPNNSAPDFNGKDRVSPVIFMTASHGFFGTSSFMRWNGTPRNLLDTLEDDVLGLRGRIVFGDVNFPWDGSTVPVPV